MATDLIFKFSRNEKSTPKKVILDIKGFTEYHNRNGYYFTFEDLLNGPDKISVRKTHKGQLFADTYLVDRTITFDKQGKVLTGQIVSENKDFISRIDELTGFSIELGILRETDLFKNDAGEFVIKQGSADFRSIAALYGELPGSGGTEIINKQFEFSLVGSGKVPAKDNLQTNLQPINNTIMDKQHTTEELEGVVAKAVESQLTAFFEAQAQKEAEAKKITFSLSKEATVTEVIDAVKAQFNFELQEKQDPADKVAEAAKEADNAKMNFAANAKSNPIEAGEKKPEPQGFTFETVRDNN